MANLFRSVSELERSNRAQVKTPFATPMASYLLRTKMNELMSLSLKHNDNTAVSKRKGCGGGARRRVTLNVINSSPPPSSVGHHFATLKSQIATPQIVIYTQRPYTTTTTLKTIKLPVIRARKASTLAAEEAQLDSFIQVSNQVAWPDQLAPC